MSLNFDKSDDIVVGCIPIKMQPEPPEDYQNPYVSQCEECDNDIWMSDKKKQVKLDYPNAICLCMFCCLKKIGQLDSKNVNIHNIGEGMKSKNPGEDLEM